MTLRVAVTGAGGFLGTALTRRLAAGGAEVHSYARRPIDLPGVRWHPYDLACPRIAQSIPENVDAVVHAAFSMSGAGSMLEQLNYDAARNLHAAARRRGAHFVFISSMSAHAQAASSYGRAKWRIESLLDAAVDTVVRPGLIIGPGGLYARMFDMLRRTPVLPLFYGGIQPVQPIGIDDLVEGLRRIVTGHTTGVFNLGIPFPITIRALYGRMLAAAKLCRPILPLPGNFTLGILRVCERMGLRLPLTSENLLGLKWLRPFETGASLAQLELSLTSLEELPWGAP